MNIETIPLKSIKPGDNVRLDLKEDDLAQLMDSIKTIGLLQPIGVKPNRDKFDILYGNRRFHAMRKLGLINIPAVVHSSTEKFPLEELVKHLSENTQRKNLSANDLGMAYERLHKEKGLTINEIASLVNQSKTAVGDCMRVAAANLNENIRSKIVNTSPGKRMAVGRISSDTAAQILNRAKKGHLTRAQAERVFEQALKSPRAVAKNLNQYVVAAKFDKDFSKMDENASLCTLQPLLVMKNKEMARLKKKYIATGVYKNTARIVRAILVGELREKLNLEG